MSKVSVVSFIASAGGFGRSKALMQAAEHLCDRRQRVIIVDADLPSPSLERYASGYEGGHGLSDWLRGRLTDLPLHRVGPGLLLLSAGSPEELSRLMRSRGGFGRMADLLKTLKLNEVDYILLDLPPGYLLTGWKWAQSLLLESDLAMVFGHSLPEIQHFAWQVDRQMPGGRRPEFCPVVGLRPSFEGVGLKVLTSAGKEVSLEASDFAVFIPRIGALEEPASPSWRDAQYLAPYLALARVIGEFAEMGRRSPLADDLMRTAESAFIRSVDLKPEILPGKVEEHLTPRTFAVLGRHGAGKSALAMALEEGALARRVSPEQLLKLGPNLTNLNHEGMAPRFWLLDSPEDHVRNSGALRRTLEIAADATGGTTGIKVLLRPSTARRFGHLVHARAYTVLRWNARELLALAVQRAANRTPDFAKLLGDGSRSAVTDWGEDEMAEAGRLLFGPLGLLIWNHLVDSLWDNTSEFIPSEASQLLYFAAAYSRRMGHAGPYLIAPWSLAPATRYLFAWKLSRLPSRSRIALEEIARHHGGVVPDESGELDPATVGTLLDHGFLVLDDSSSRNRLLRIPPRLSQHLALPEPPGVEIYVPPEWEENVAPIRDISSSLASEAVQLLGNGDRLNRQGAPDQAEAVYAEAAQRFGLDGNRHGQALALLRLGSLLRKNGDLDRAEEFFREVLGLLGSGATLMRAETLRELANIQYARGRLDEANRLCEKALGLFVGERAQLGRAYTLLLQGEVQILQRKLRLAADKFNEAMVIFRSVDDRRGMAAVLGKQSDLLGSDHKMDLAMARSAEALAIYRELGDRVGEANELMRQGELLLEMGLNQEAEARLSESLQMQASLKNPLGELRTLADLAGLNLRKGELDQARQQYHKAMDIALRVGDLRGIGTIRLRLGDLLAARGLGEEAAREYAEASSVYEKMQATRDQAKVSLRQGNLALATQRYDVAERYFRQARELFGQGGDPEGQAAAQISLASAIAHRDPDAALKILAEVAGGAGDMDRPLERALALIETAEVMMTTGRMKEATDVLGEARRLSASLDDSRLVAGLLETEAHLLLKHGQRREALNRLREALQMLPVSTEYEQVRRIRDQIQLLEKPQVQ